jgi:regulator of replication initiation timing
LTLSQTLFNITNIIKKIKNSIMPNSRKRGGAKAHRKRVQKRNQTLKSDMNRLRNAFQKEMAEELKKMESQKTEIVEVEDNDSEAQTA